MVTRAKGVALLVVVLLGLGWLMWAWYRPEPPMSSAAFAEAKEARAVNALLKQDVPVRAVKVLPKAAAVKKLKLPREVADNPATEVLTAVDVPRSRGGATVVTLIDSTTGEARTLVREKKPPLVSLELGTEIGMRYGLSSEGGRQAVAFARQDLLRVGPAYLAVYGEVDSDADALAMVEVSYRW